MNVKMTRICEDDLELVMDWRMRPYITKYMNTDPVLSIEGQRQWFKYISNRNDQIHWIINYVLGGGINVPVGLINVVDIDRINNRCSWGYYVAEKKYRSFELAVGLECSLYDYVFDVLKLHKLCNETWRENEGVISLHAICGSREDGILREHIFKNGAYHDVSAGSILAPEWFARRDSMDYSKFEFE